VLAATLLGFCHRGATLVGSLSLRQPTTRALSAVLWVCVGLLVLDVWGVSVTGLWAVLVSVATLIDVGFLAGWTIVSNITASFFLTLWHPFHLGEVVEVLLESLKGRVIDRNLMFTVLREEHRTTLHVPTNFFFQKIFRVAERKAQYMFEFLEHGGRRADAAPEASTADRR
jgi:small-conductance mechanosensitive channel